MSKIADEICAEIRQQCADAEHFKGLWMQVNDELEKVREQRDALVTATEKMITISDRKHDAWDEAKAVISTIKGHTHKQ